MSKIKKGSFKGLGKLNAEKKAKEASGYGYLNLPKGVSVFSPTPGKSVTLDFLIYEVTTKNHPDKIEEKGLAVKGSYWYKRPFRIHRNVGTGKDSVVCLSSIGKPCPICEYKIKRAKEGADKDELAGLKASLRNLYVVNPLDSDKHKAGDFHIFDISEAMLQNLIEEEFKEDSIPDDFFDLEEGVSLKIRFASSTIGNSKPFAEANKITPVDRKRPYKESVADETPKLDDVLNILSYDELKYKFFEMEDVVEKEEDEKPVRKKKIIKEEEEEEEEKPVRKKKAPVVEEEEEEEEEDAPTFTWSDLQAMNEKQLLKFIKTDKIDVDPDDFEDDEKGLRKAIAKELDIDIPKTAAKGLPPKEDRCPACGGTGKNSKGGVCKVCMGTGVKQKDDEEEEEEEEEKPKKTSSKKQDHKGDKCPSGHRFGVDTDKFDECDSCDLWDECMSAKKKAK